MWISRRATDTYTVYPEEQSWKLKHCCREIDRGGAAWTCTGLSSLPFGFQKCSADTPAHSASARRGRAQRRGAGLWLCEDPTACATVWANRMHTVEGWPVRVRFRPLRERAGANGPPPCTDVRARRRPPTEVSIYHRGKYIARAGPLGSLGIGQLGARAYVPVPSSAIR